MRLLSVHGVRPNEEASMQFLLHGHQRWLNVHAYIPDLPDLINGNSKRTKQPCSGTNFTGLAAHCSYDLCLPLPPCSISINEHRLITYFSRPDTLYAATLTLLLYVSPHSTINTSPSIKSSVKGTGSLNKSTTQSTGTQPDHSRIRTRQPRLPYALTRCRKTRVYVWW
jgi:hypothetical protein